MPALTAKRRAHAADMGSFLPRYVLRKPKVEKAMPYMEQLTTAVLFADVSGFTKLSEKLAHKGGRGAAEIAAYLNQYFSQLVKIINRNGALDTPSAHCAAPRLTRSRHAQVAT